MGGGGGGVWVLGGGWVLGGFRVVSGGSRVGHFSLSFQRFRLSNGVAIDWGGFRVGLGLV